ncbi:hypothetical protein D3C75_636860 [compost metagenome]
MNVVNLNTLEEQPQEVQEAIAFYACYTVNGMRVTAEERALHYSVLERAGLIEPLKSVVDA